MRITANLAPKPLPLALPAALSLWLLAIGAVGFAAWLGTVTLDERRELPALRERLARLEVRARSATARAPLSPASALAEVRMRVAQMNALSQVRGWPAPRLLAWLERRLPPEVHLVSLQHRLREGEIRLVAESPSTQALTAFLLILEREPHFGDVLLARQSAGGGRGDSVQFEIRFKERT